MWFKHDTLKNALITVSLMVPLIAGADNHEITYLQQNWTEEEREYSTLLIRALALFLMNFFFTLNKQEMIAYYETTIIWLV